MCSMYLCGEKKVAQERKRRKMNQQIATAKKSLAMTSFKQSWNDEYSDSLVSTSHCEEVRRGKPTQE
jgi:hypothetical protein